MNRREVRLKELAGQGGANLYERVKVALELHADRQWVDLEHGGDEFKAAKYLEDTYFGDLCGAVSFFEFKKVYEVFPTLEDWRKKKFNLKVLWVEIKIREKGAKAEQPRPGRRVAKLEELEERDRKIDALKGEVGRLQEENRRMQSRINELERENARMEGRVAEMSRLLDRMPVATM